MREHAEGSRSHNPALQGAPEWARRRAARYHLPDNVRDAYNRLDALEGVVPDSADVKLRECEVQLAEATL